jgi:hypothetical protein
MDACNFRQLHNNEINQFFIIGFISFFNCKVQVIEDKCLIFTMLFKKVCDNQMQMQKWQNLLLAM